MKKLKLGMVGGGQGGFIGGVHRFAARLDNRWDLVAGALSSNSERAAASAAELGLKRSYASYEQMAVAEAAMGDGIDAVSIVTPNHMHAGPAITFLNAGIHVICDKPLAATQEQADASKKAAAGCSYRTSTSRSTGPTALWRRRWTSSPRGRTKTSGWSCPRSPRPR